MSYLPTYVLPTYLFIYLPFTYLCPTYKALEKNDVVKRI